MDSFLSCFDEYVNTLLSSASFQSLSLLTSNTEIIIPYNKIVNVLNEELYNSIISSLPISLSVLEEIPTNTNGINGIFIKGRIKEKRNDIVSEIEIYIDDNNKSSSSSSSSSSTTTIILTTTSSIFDIYQLPSSLIQSPNVGSYYFISKKNSNNEVLLHCLLERIEYNDQLEGTNMKYFIFNTNHIGANYNDDNNSNLCRFMIPVNDINIYHSTVGNDDNNSLSNSFFPSKLYAWTYFIINNNNCNNNDNNEITDLSGLTTISISNGDIDIIRNGLSRIIISIESQVLDISTKCRISNTNDERDNNSIKVIDDDFVRSYQYNLRCLHDCYHIVSILIQLSVPLQEKQTMSDNITSIINTIIETTLVTVNELFAKLLYLCPTLYFITSNQWVDIISYSFDTRSLIFFIVSQIQSYNKRVKKLKKEFRVSSRLLSDKDMKAFAETIVDILDDLQDTNILAIDYVIRTHFMTDIMKQDWLSDKEFRRGQCINYGIKASLLLINRLLTDIKIKMYQYPFYYVNCCISSLKMMIDIVKEVYMNISCTSRTRSKQFLLDLKCIVVGTIDILYILQNESAYNIENMNNNDDDDYLWYGKKQSIFKLDFMERIINMRMKCFENGNNNNLFSVENNLINKAMFSFNINTNFSEQLDDQLILDLITSILEVQLILFILENDNEDIADLIEININDLIIDEKGLLFSLRHNEKIGLDIIMNMVSNYSFNSNNNNQSQWNHMQYDFDRVSKCTISKDILKFVTIDPIYINSILSKHYVCIGEENDFPILNELEISKKMKLNKLSEKIKQNSNYISLD